MSVTLCMDAKLDVHENSEALVKFFKSACEASKATNAAWIRFRCIGIPAELESALQASLNKIENKPNLTLVVNNAQD